MSRAGTLLVLLALSLAAGLARADEYSCGLLSYSGQYGPYDYRVDKGNLPIVEGAHFTPDVEALRHGKSAPLGGDIDYTLRAFPNHHRALLSMMKLGERLNVNKVPGANWNVECYFDRAIRWRPDDGTVRMIYGVWLVKHGRGKDSIPQLEKAAELDGDVPNVTYNLGLVYLDLKDYDKALRYAQKAYMAGFPLPGLRDKLKAVGKWVPPDATQGNGRPVAAPEETVKGAPQGENKTP
ncbi:MAG: tetratricopeptide repeat protein [Rhodocyclaceae bacterium]|nr:tetratricopeptide repeat protein [Rhodocyclaceae bacterium]